MTDITPESLSVQVRKLIAASIALYVLSFVLTVTVVYSWSNSIRQAQQVSCQSTEALKIILRDEKIQKVGESEKFLRDNPDGIPGIASDVIEESIARDRAVILQLKPIDC